jgi:hypothetical protein
MATAATSPIIKGETTGFEAVFAVLVRFRVLLN